MLAGECLLFSDNSPGNRTRLALVTIPRRLVVGWKEQLPALSSEDLGLLFASCVTLARLSPS